MKIVMLQNTEKNFYTLEEYKEHIKEAQTDKDNKVIALYATNVEEQYSYIQNAKSRGYDVLVMDGQLDTHFIAMLEQKDENVRYVRVDSDVIDKLIQKEDAKQTTFTLDEQEEMRIVFDTQLPKGEAMYHVTFEAMGADAEPVIVTRSEFMRRMKDMAAMNPQMSYFGTMGDQYNLVVNTDHPLSQKVLEQEKSALGVAIEPLTTEIQTLNGQIAEIDALNNGVKADEISQSDKDRKADIQKQIQGLKDKKSELLTNYGKDNKLVGQLIDLALLANGLLKGEALSKFVKRSVELIK